MSVLFKLMLLTFPSMVFYDFFSECVNKIVEWNGSGSVQCSGTIEMI